MNIVIIIIALLGLISVVIYSAKNSNRTTPVSSIDQDQDVINNLIKYGSNPEKEHSIEFAFFGDWSNMNKVKDILLTQGYTQDASQTDKMLVITKFHKLHLDEIKAETKKMEDLAKQYNVEFDGWSAAIVR